MKESLNPTSLDFKTIFPFKLDDFQQSAIAALAAGKSVVVCAPTGSGKTLIGEYAIYRALERGKRVFYTTPMKALSNQKFRDFQEKFGRTPTDGDEDSPLLFAEVGLITGDVVINPSALIVVMTTEIFRNMLYQTPIGEVGTSLENVETLVLDECHYISDRGRGTVWEESIIYCPPSIQLVALSATIGNPGELTDWINWVRQQPQPSDNKQTSSCELINSDFRPVPLRFYFVNICNFYQNNSVRDVIGTSWYQTFLKLNRNWQTITFLFIPVRTDKGRAVLIRAGKGWIGFKVEWPSISDY